MSDNYRQREEIFSKSVRAGKRTYFFDVKSTKTQDYYITVTESKKRMGDDGNPYFEKHKIFLYGEDFQKFMDGLNEAIDHVNKLSPPENRKPHQHESPEQGSSFSDVNFDDLGS